MKLFNKIRRFWEKLKDKFSGNSHSEEDKLRVIFTGNQVDAKFVKAMLEDNGIPCLLKDPYNVSITAGWVTPGGAEHGTQLLVEQKNFMKASYLMDKNFNEDTEE